MTLVAARDTLLGSLAAAFTDPGFQAVFAPLTAWVLTPGRHTLSRLFLSGGERSQPNRRTCTLSVE